MSTFLERTAQTVDRMFSLCRTWVPITPVPGHCVLVTYLSRRPNLDTTLDNRTPWSKAIAKYTVSSLFGIIPCDILLLVIYLQAVADR